MCWCDCYNLIGDAQNARDKTVAEAKRTRDKVVEETTNAFETIAEEVNTAIDDTWTAIKVAGEDLTREVLKPVLHFIFTEILQIKDKDVLYVSSVAVPLFGKPMPTLPDPIIKAIIGNTNIADSIIARNRKLGDMVQRMESAEYILPVKHSTTFTDYRSVDVLQFLSIGSTEDSSKRNIGHMPFETRVWATLCWNYNGDYGGKTVTIDGAALTGVTVTGYAGNALKAYVHGSDGTVKTVDLVHNQARTIYGVYNDTKIYALTQDQFSRVMSMEQTDKMMPIYTIISKKTAIDTSDKNKEHIDIIEKGTGINVKDLIKQVQKGENKNNVSATHVLWGIDLYSENENMHDLTYIYLAKHVASGTKDKLWTTTIYTGEKRIIPGLGFHSHKSKTTTYAGYNMQLAGTATRGIVNEVIGKVGEVSVSIKDTVYTIKKQVTGITTDVITITGLAKTVMIWSNGSYAVDTATFSEDARYKTNKDGDEVRQVFLIPLEKGLIEQLDYDKQEVALQQTLHMVIYAGQWQHLEYYQTEEFGQFVEFAAIAITVISLGSAYEAASAATLAAGGTIAAAEAAGMAALMAALEDMAMIAIASKMMQKAFDGDNKLFKILSVVAMIAAVAYSGQGGDQMVDKLVSDPSLLLTSVDGWVMTSKMVGVLAKANQLQYEADMGDLQDQIARNEKITRRANAALREEMKDYEDKYGNTMSYSEFAMWQQARAQAEVNIPNPYQDMDNMLGAGMYDNEVLYKLDAIYDLDADMHQGIPGLS